MPLSARNQYCIPALLLIGLIIFLPVCGFEFLGYDDDVNITGNHLVTNVTADNLLRFWKAPYEQLYIPLTYNLWSFQAWLSHFFPGGGGNPLNSHLFHTVNLLVHLCSTCLVFLILRTLIKKAWAACAGAIIFLVHPVQVEAVAWVTGFKDLLSGFWALAAVWLYISYSKAERAKVLCKVYFVLAVASFLLALLAKPGSIITPLVIGVIGYFLLNRSVRQLAFELGPWCLLALPFVAVTMNAQPTDPSQFQPAFWQRFLIGGDTLFFYLYKLLLPITLGSNYGRTPEFVLGHGWAYLTGVIPYLLVLALLWKASKSWFVPVGIFVVSILPVLGFISFDFQLISTTADRYLYFAMLGPALGTGWLLAYKTAPAVKMVLIAGLVLLGGKSMLQVQHWKNPFTFNGHEIKVNPNSAHAYLGLGFALANNNQKEEAILSYQKALEIDPRLAPVYHNLGTIYKDLKRNEDAVFYFLKALELNPGYAKAYINLGNIYLEANKNEEAVSYFQKAIQFKPDDYTAYFNLGATYQKMNRMSEAIDAYQKAIRINSGFASAYSNLGALYNKINRTDEAIIQLKKAVELDPSLLEAYNNLGFVYAKVGRGNEAIELYKKAITINPKHPMLHNNLGIEYARVSRDAEAEAAFKRALVLDPNFESAQQNLSRLYKILRKAPPGNQEK